MAIVALNKDEHRELRIRPMASFELVEDAHMLPVTAYEIMHIGADCPVVFVKNEETGQFRLVAVLGLEAGENLYVRDGKWRAMFVPGVIHHNPFRLIPDPGEPERVTVGLDTESMQLQEQEGERLFDDSGEETGFLQSRKKALAEYLEHEQLTEQVVAYLAQQELLAPRDLRVTVNDDEINVAGMYTVDEEKLAALSNDEFGELRKRGLLPVIYGHLASLNQVRRLARYRSEA